MAKKNLWNQDELVITLSLYFQLPFGRLNHATPEVKELAALLGRSDNSIAMRLSNFAACDPYIINSGRHGLSSGVQVCKPVWDKYYDNREQLFIDAANIRAQYLKKPIEKILGITETDLEGTTKEVVVKQRVNQDVFRAMILNNYNSRCALTGIDIPELLVASHIKPWAKCKEERLNPENGICLSSLYDTCFDKGLIGFDKDFKVVLSKRITERCDKEFYNEHFGIITNRKLIMPDEHKPNKLFLEWHMDEIFLR